jgi:hypothetical protein
MCRWLFSGIIYFKLAKSCYGYTIFWDWKLGFAKMNFYENIACIHIYIYVCTCRLIYIQLPTHRYWHVNVWMYVHIFSLHTYVGMCLHVHCMHLLYFPLRTQKIV